MSDFPIESAGAGVRERAETTDETVRNNIIALVLREILKVPTYVLEFTGHKFT